MSESVATPALTAEQVSTITRQTNYGTWRFQKSWKPLTIADAEGCWFTDGAGKRYLDFSSQLMCVNLGHKNPRVVEAIAIYPDREELRREYPELEDADIRQALEHAADTND